MKFQGKQVKCFHVMFVMNGIVIAALTSSHRLLFTYHYLYAVTVLTLEFTISFRFYH